MNRGTTVKSVTCINLLTGNKYDKEDKKFYPEKT